MVNFGVIKSQVSQMLGEHYLNGQHGPAEEVFRDYMRTVRNSPVLMLEYIVFKNLERKDVLREAACKYVDSNVALFKDYSRKQILAENAKLEKFKQNVRLSTEDKILFENIQSLILESAGDNKIPNVSKIHDCLTTIMESVMAPSKPMLAEEDSEELLEGFAFDDAFRIATRQFNTKFAAMTDGERKVVQVLSEGTDVQKRGLFDELKLQALRMVTESTEDPELRAQGMQEIDSKPFNNATLEEDILDLYELVN